jgi:hypothetical protein
MKFNLNLFTTFGDEASVQKWRPYFGHIRNSDTIYNIHKLWTLSQVQTE